MTKAGMYEAVAYRCAGGWFRADLRLGSYAGDIVWECPIDHQHDSMKEARACAARHMGVEVKPGSMTEEKT